MRGLDGNGQVFEPYGIECPTPSRVVGCAPTTRGDFSSLLVGEQCFLSRLLKIKFTMERMESCNTTTCVSLKFSPLFPKICLHRVTSVIVKLKNLRFITLSLCEDARNLHYHLCAYKFPFIPMPNSPNFLDRIIIIFIEQDFSLLLFGKVGLCVYFLQF